MRYFTGFFHTNLWSYTSQFRVDTLQYSCLESPMDGGAWWAAVHGVIKSRTQLSDFTFTFLFHALEKEMATHSSILAWRIPGTGEPGGLPSMGSHRVGHDWSDLAAVAATVEMLKSHIWLAATILSSASLQYSLCLPLSSLAHALTLVYLVLPALLYLDNIPRFLQFKFWLFCKDNHCKTTVISWQALVILISYTL